VPARRAPQALGRRGSGFCNIGLPRKARRSLPGPVQSREFAKQPSIDQPSPVSSRKEVSAELARMGEQLRTVRQELETQREEVHFQQDALRIYQRQLEESRERYAELYEQAPMPYLSLGASGIIVSVNFAGRVCLAAAAKQLIGSPFMLLVASSDRRVFMRHLRLCRRSSSVTRTKLALVLGSTETKVELVSTAIHEFATNKLVYLTVFLPVNMDETALTPFVANQ
jgi:PAS domain-containing protein